MKSKENARRLVSITVRLAEMEGFEPPRWFPNLPVFKTGPFNPLGTSPCCSIVLDFLLDTDGNRNRRTAKRPEFMRRCGIGRSFSPHGFQDRTLQPLGYISVLFNCLRFSLRYGRKPEPAHCKKARVHAPLRDRAFLFTPRISRPPRYDRFGNPPCMLTPFREVTTI